MLVGSIKRTKPSKSAVFWHWFRSDGSSSFTTSRTSSYNSASTDGLSPLSSPTALVSAFALLLVLPCGVAAFATTKATTIKTTGARRPCAFLLSSYYSSASDGGDVGSGSNSNSNGDDSYDQWYADFDPSEFEEDSRRNDGDLYGGDRRRSGGGGGGSRRGGGTIYGGSEYTRDTSRDNSNVDEAAVYALLEDRIQAKRRRDFDEADAIRDQLLSEHAVVVYDREKTWRTGASASGSGMGGRRGAYGRRNNNSGGGYSRRERGGGGRQRRDRDWGPNGHDYNLSPDAGPNSSSLDESEIHSIIAERLQAKLSRSYDIADRLQRELVEQGIYVHDGMKEWRADGVPYGDIRGDGVRPGKSDRNRPYAKSPYSNEVQGASDDEISELVEKRSRFKIAREYMMADNIRDELLDTYNVHVDDRVREWSAGGDFGSQYNEQRQLSRAMKNRGYVKSDYSADLPSPADEEYIQGKVDERVEARKNRDFDTADDIRQELLSDFGVTIHDRLRKWSVGGDFGDELPKGRGDYTRRGGGNLSKEDVLAIQAAINERSEAKKNRDFYVADEIRDRLRNTYQIIIDDDNKEWHVECNDYVQSAVGQGSRVLSDDEIEIVQSKIAERAACRREKDYERADAIRDELIESFSVLIDDRTKEWRTAAKDGGEFDDFAEESLKSQQSPFKNKQQMEEQIQELDGEFDSIFNSGANDDSEGVASELLEEREASLSRDDLSALTVVELKERLRQVGKPVSGRKAELIDRLLA